jgi:hypothetical protein
MLHVYCLLLMRIVSAAAGAAAVGIDASFDGTSDYQIT